MKSACGFAALLALSLCSSDIAQACASCGCTLNSGFETLSTDNENDIESRFRLDLRYDYIDQTQLRSGTGTISAAAASAIVNNGNPQEVEQYTLNNYLTLGVDYVADANWNVDAQLPFIFRSHSTLGTASNGTTAGLGGGQYDSNTSTPGDARITGVYYGLSARHELGLIVGAKLPTGSHTLTGTSTDPSVPGSVPIDRGLQPGTGTTDVIFGIYYIHPFDKNWDYYTQDQYQFALDSVDEYRPGNSISLNAGIHYTGFASVTPALQVNYRYADTDSGLNSDNISTGGTLVYLSPGASAPLSAKVSVYGFVQIPVYQNLDGVQLAPTFTTSLGARYVF
jgi:hypothetical protein